MDELGNVAHSIPYLAVFQADNPNEPQILRDLFSKDDLLAILSEPPDLIEVDAIKTGTTNDEGQNHGQ